MAGKLCENHSTDMVFNRTLKRVSFLDEPLTFLDLCYQFKFLQQVVRLVKQSDLIVVGVLNDLNLAARFAYTLTLLNKEIVIDSALPKDQLPQETIREVYGLQAEIHFLNNHPVIIYNP